MQPILVGADPEFFVRNKFHYVPGHIFGCGTKENPLKTDHGAVQVDGTALECNVNPSATREEFISNVRGAISDLNGIVKECIPSASVVATPTVYWGRRRLSSFPTFASRLGCEPDYNAYTKNQNSTPDVSQPFRTGSGHVHVSWTKDANVHNKAHFNLCCEIAAELDYYLGLPSLIWDTDEKRRTLYGKPGAFRPKPYGLEYRVLSNKWTETDRLIGYVFDNTLRSVKAVLHGPTHERLSTQYGNRARMLISTNRSHWPNLSINDKIADVVLQ